MEISPLKILKEAQESIPAVKYAGGVAGIAAVVAIVAGFQLDYRIAIFGTVIVLGLMFVLVIFSSFVAHSGPSTVILASVAAWSFLLLTIATSLFLMTSYFFSWPRAIDSYIQTPPVVPSDYFSDSSQDPQLEILNANGYARFSSEQGDYIGQGEVHEFSDENGIFSVTGDKNSISVYFEGDDHWSFVFAAPRNKDLSVGAYTSAQRAAFHNPVKPGIDISGAGRGCNEISGSFLVKEIEFAGNDNLERFVAEFEQHCEDEAPMLKGEINITVGE